MEPTLKRVSKNGEWVWEVTYNGIARYHAQDWQARWIYEQALRLYSKQANLASIAPAKWCLACHRAHDLTLNCLENGYEHPVPE